MGAICLLPRELVTNMKTHRFILASGILLAGLTHSQATTLGFGQLGGNNATVPANFGSFATTDGNGYVVSGGTTPNVGLTWDSGWDIHTSNFFAPLEDTTVGGGAWDNEGGVPRIAQLDFGNHTINFTVDDGFALQLDSFDFGHTAETPGNTSWDLTLTAVSSSTVVWSQSVSFVNGQVFTITPNFTGVLGEDYLLTFNRTSETYNFSNGRHGIDNLTFYQVIPEPTTATLLGLAGLAVFARSRRK